MTGLTTSVLYQICMLACLLFAVTLAACSAPVKVERVDLRAAYADLNRTALSSIRGRNDHYRPSPAQIRASPIIDPAWEHLKSIGQNGGLHPYRRIDDVQDYPGRIYKRTRRK